MQKIETGISELLKRQPVTEQEKDAYIQDLQKALRLLLEEVRDLEEMVALLQKKQFEPFPQNRTQKSVKKRNKNTEISRAALRRRKRQVQPQSVQAKAIPGQNGGGWCCRKLRDRQTHRSVQQSGSGSA